MQKRRIALYHPLTAGFLKRGPKVFFPTFFNEYCKSERNFELYYFVKTNDFKSLQLEYEHDELKHANVIVLHEFPTRFHSFLASIELIAKLLYHRISLIHVLTYNNRLDPLPQLKWIQRLQPLWNIKKAFVITYDGIPTAHKMKYQGRYNLDIKYENLFRAIQFEGIYSWYDDFVEWVHTSGVFEKKPLVKCIHSRFCDMSKYAPADKQREIVWASALVDYKRPDMFMEAIVLLHKKNKALFDGWAIKFYGNGPFESELKQLIQEANLSELVTLEPSTNNLAPVFNKSSCYVSTQELENFPSLAMNEAMAAGNVIIARNVGRTHLFVEHGKNGFLAPTDDAQGIADCLEQFLSAPGKHLDMMQHSRHLCDTVHTPENFIREIDAFWSELLA